MKKILLFAIVCLCFELTDAQDFIFQLLANGKSVAVTSAERGNPAVLEADYYIHIVKKGETMYGIADSFKIADKEAFYRFNNIKPPYRIYPETEIRIPKSLLTLNNKTVALVTEASNVLAVAPSANENQRTESPSITYILAVGIRVYSVGGLDSLKFGDSSAVRIANLIESQQGVVYDSVKSIVLCGNVVKAKVLDSIQKIRDMMRPQDQLFIYFGGHSAVGYDGKAFLCPSDFNQSQEIVDSHLDCAISVENLYSAFYREDNKESNILVMLDVCNANTFGWPLANRGLSDRLNLSVISACDSSEQALEGDRIHGSVFVRAMEIIMNNQYYKSCKDGSLEGVYSDLLKLMPELAGMLKRKTQNPKRIRNYPGEKPVIFYKPEPAK